MIAALSLVAVVLAARLTHGRGRRAGWWLVAAAVLWLLADKPMEGPTVVHLTADHGITGADLAGITGLVLGVHQVWPHLSRRGWTRLVRIGRR